MTQRARLPPPSVPVIDPRTGLMAVDWYDFFVVFARTETLDDYPNDVQAANGGVALYGLYRSGSTVKVRTT